MPGKLAVLTGRHDGALSPTASAGTLIGSAPECDVVLTDSGVRPIHASISPIANAAAVRAHADAPLMLAGAAARDGEITVAGWQPWQLGAVWLAWVPAEFAWGQSEPWPRPPPPVAAGRAARAPVVALGAVLGALLLAALVAAIPRSPRPAAASIQHAAMSAEAGVRALALPDIMLSHDGGRLRIDGWVATQGEFDRLLAAAGGSSASTSLRVRIGADVARRAAEFVGADAQADYLGSGRIRLSTPAVAPAAAEQVAARVERLRADLGPAVTIEADLPAAPAAPPRAQPIPVRIVEVQADDPPHFRTSDGARYFIGARLPDGAEVVQIAHNEITFRRGERLIPYRLAE